MDLVNDLLLLFFFLLLLIRVVELQHGVEVVDLGTHDDGRVDYPDFGAAVGKAVAAANKRSRELA